MASNFYHMILPDYRDIDNATGHRPGFFFGVRENDGGIGLYIYPADSPGNGPDEHSVFLNIEEARELVEALREAIDHAAPKNRGGLAHPRRVRQPGS